MVFRRLFSSCCGPGDHPAPPGLRVGQVPKEVRGGGIPDPPWQDRGALPLPGLPVQWSRSEAFPQAAGKGAAVGPVVGMVSGVGDGQGQRPPAEEAGRAVLPVGLGRTVGPFDFSR